MLTVLLMAALTYAISKTDSGARNFDSEQTSIAVSDVSSFAADLRRAVDLILRGGNSEGSLSFAHASLTGYGTPDTDAAVEVFNIAGGGASYKDVPEKINDGSQWEFYSFTAAPVVGDDAAPDLMLVLPHVTENFCRAFNTRAGYAADAAIPTDSDTCLHDTARRFDGSFATGGDINTMDSAGFKTPAAFACVACDGPVYNAYYVLEDR